MIFEWLPSSQQLQMSMKSRGKKADKRVEQEASGSEPEEEEPRLKHAAFADAMNKLLHRSLKTDGNPVLAKRHTAAEKRVAADRSAALEAKAHASARDKQRKAHLFVPSVEPNVVMEKALRRIATTGGMCSWHCACSSHLLALLHFGSCFHCQLSHVIVSFVCCSCGASECHQGSASDAG